MGEKPILGCEAYVVDHDYRERHEYFQAHPGLKEKRFHLCLHAKNLVGYHNLVKHISEAHINGKYMRPRIDPPRSSRGSCRASDCPGQEFL